MTKRSLTFRQKLLVAGTLFGMFFGAGNLIFPVHLGQLAGRSLIPAILGFILTAVGLPVLAAAAIGNTHSEDLQSLAGKVGRRYSYIFTCLLYLTIGPFFAIPRCATTSFTTGVLPMLGDSGSKALALFLFSLVFFAFVLFFSLYPANIAVWIGKIINPIFLFFLAVLVFAALKDPGAAASSVEPVPAYQSHVLLSATVEGYGTMDAIALAQISRHYLGRVGGLVLAVTITLILMALFGNFFHHDRRVYVSVTAFTLIAALFDFLWALPESLRARLHLDGLIKTAGKVLPFFAAINRTVITAATSSAATTENQIPSIPKIDGRIMTAAT